MDISGNWILSGSDVDEQNEIQRVGKEVKLGLGRQLDPPGEDASYLYFPTDGLISQLVLLESGQAGEVAVIGHEGMLGIHQLLGPTFAAPLYSNVQGEGRAIRVPSAAGLDLFAAGGAFQRRVLQFTGALMLQFAQTAVCNRHHNIEQHFARWILLILDRLGDQGEPIVMTQEMIANMLGVRREGVNATARKFQSMGLIEYRRGTINVIDRNALADHCCECYDIISKNYSQLL